MNSCGEEDRELEHRTAFIVVFFSAKSINRSNRPVLHEHVAVSVSGVLGGGGPASINNDFNLLQAGVEAHVHHHNLARSQAVVVRQGHDAVHQLHSHQEGAPAQDDIV